METRLSIACFIRNDSMYEPVLDVLVRHGFHGVRFTDEPALGQALAGGVANLVLADVEDASESAIATWRSCRFPEHIPVILLSFVSDDRMMINALDAGADDLIVISIEPDEFAARLKAILRRYRMEVPRHTVTLAGFEFDMESAMTLDNGKLVELTPTEFALAWILFSFPGQYLSRDLLSLAVWGRSGDIAGRTLEQHVYKLRRKLNLNASRGVQIRAAYNRGYCLEVGASAQPVAP